MRMHSSPDDFQRTAERLSRVKGHLDRILMQHSQLLMQFHQLNSLSESSRPAKVSAIRGPLKRVGTNPEIGIHLSPRERIKLTEREMKSLASRARDYIAYLEREISTRHESNESAKSTLRKVNSGGKR